MIAALVTTHLRAGINCRYFHHYQWTNHACRSNYCCSNRHFGHFLVSSQDQGTVVAVVTNPGNQHTQRLYFIEANHLRSGGSFFSAFRDPVWPSPSHVPSGIHNLSFCEHAIVESTIISAIYGYHIQLQKNVKWAWRVQLWITINSSLQIPSP